LFRDLFKINARFLDATIEENPYLKEFPVLDHDDLISYDNIIVKTLRMGK
jgi:hypothetical protein